MATFALPCGAGFLAFSNASPLRRVFTAYFEYQPQLSLQTIPLLLVLSYIFLQIGDAIYTFVTIGLAQLRSTKFWYGHLRPEQMVVVPSQGGWSIVYRNSKGFHVGLEKMLMLCKEHDYLTTLFNIPFGSWGVSIHHSSTIVLTVMGTYITVKYYHLFAQWPVLFLAPVGSFVVIILEYFETVFIEDSSKAFMEFLYALKSVTRQRLVDSKTKDQIRAKKKYLERYMWALRIVRCTTSGSFYELTRENLLCFYGQCCDFLVSLLIF